MKRKLTQAEIALLLDGDQRNIPRTLKRKSGPTYRAIRILQVIHENTEPEEWEKYRELILNLD